MTITDKVVSCCDEMREELKDDNLISALDNVPFSDKKTEPTVYICSDGGHGGLAIIKFCPFCGTQIAFK